MTEPDAPLPAVEDDEYIRQRRLKAQALVDEFGVDPFWGAEVRPDGRCGELAATYATYDDTALAALERSFCLAGRVTALRRFGKAGFLDLSDFSGRLQVYVKKDALAEREFSIYKQALDLGDFLAVEGRFFRTDSGELTLRAERLHFLSKALRGLPEKWHGLTDVETQYRQRYLDLTANAETRRRFTARSRIVSAIRRSFDRSGFLEVETPMLHQQATGAAARPFYTHHNALGLDLVLRIAPELHLKRLVVGGFDRVYELNRNFRNEGISTQHNPEFTMLEFYEAYATVDRLMDRIGALLAELAQMLHGDTRVSYQGNELDFGNVERASVFGLLQRYAQATSNDCEDPACAARFALARGVAPAAVARTMIQTFGGRGLMALAEAAGGGTRATLATLQAAQAGDAPLTAERYRAAESQLAAELLDQVATDAAMRDRFVAAWAERVGEGDDPRVPAGALAMLVFEHEVEAQLQQPIFVTEFPIAVSPLARRVEPRVFSNRREARSHLAARFELFIAGREIANGFQELNDPDDQRSRFEFQLRAKTYGDEEAMELDEDYLRALEHGLPPTSGAGIGIDRLVMLLTDAPSIRDVILFPVLKPKGGAA